MKIAYCIPSLHMSGGTERVLAVKVNYFAEVLGYDIHVILTDAKDNKPCFPLSPKITIVNLDIDFDQMAGKSFIGKALMYRKKQSIYKKRLKELLFDIRPDITVSTLRREISFLTSMNDGSRKVGEYHWNSSNMCDAFSEEMTILKKLISVYRMKQLLLSLKRLDKFVVLSHEDAKQWREVPNTIVIPNPLSFFPDDVSVCSSKIVIAAGRYFRKKGFDLLIEAWKIVSEMHPEWTLRIYGTEMKEPLSEQIERLRIEESCFLEEPVYDIENKFIERSIFVLSSRFEGFPLVLAEAMACGIPVVSFDSTYGLREIIHDGVDGMERENIHSLASKISCLIKDDALRKGMGQMARKNIKRFKMENIASKWNGLFESLCREPGTEEKPPLSEETLVAREAVS